MPDLIEYPLDFPLKIMGRNEPGFVDAVVGIVRTHAPDLDDATVELRRSKKNSYLSVTSSFAPCRANSSMPCTRSSTIIRTS